MTRKTHLFFLAVGALLVGLAAGRALFLPALKLLFADWSKNLAQYSEAERADAAWNFSLGLSLLAVMVPLSAVITERFAAQAKYSHALMKSLLVGALVFGAARFYWLEHFASRTRLAAKGFGSTTTQLLENPLAKVVWLTAVCLLVFGPVDLWIARMQKQWRKQASEVSPQKPD